ncbi:MAG: CTP-dependent riboflavin kinase [Acidobacteria bacterium]|nr:CTP-dependent riboflavin kinase [Acidobacteriota bacterium]
MFASGRPGKFSKTEQAAGDCSVSPLRIEGRLLSGLGRGAQFLGLDWVRQQLKEKLGLTPFPGTLNLQVTPEVFQSVLERRSSFLKIADPASPHCPGFLRQVMLRANGQVCKSAYLIVPELTSYHDVLEVISDRNLREALQLKDGDRVELEEVSG